MVFWNKNNRNERDESSGDQAGTLLSSGVSAMSSGDGGDSTARAIPLITLDTESSSKFSVTDEGRSFLSRVEGPIAVVAVVGKYRTGKSYLLNSILLNRPDGFTVGPTIQACTKGLWVWSEPIQVERDGRKVNVIIVDTEGIASLEADTNHDTRIFTLALLISSLFVYNSMGTIDENALSNLSLVVNLTQHIHTRANPINGEEDGTEFSQFFPSFLWVLRDFTLRLENNGEPMSSREYLEKSLEPVKGHSDTIESKNRIRRMLSGFFENRDCFTLVRPVNDEGLLQALDKADAGQLRPEFVEASNRLRARVWKSSPLKMLHGRELDGPMLLTLCEAYVGAINTGGVPNIATAWESVCETQNARLVDTTFGEFKSSVVEQMKQELPMDAAKLSERFKEGMMLCRRKFLASLIGEADVTQEFSDKLEQLMQEACDLLSQENDRRADSACDELLEELYRPMEAEIMSGTFAKFEDFEAARLSVRNLYLEKAPKVPGKQLRLSIFMEQKLSEAASKLAAQAEGKAAEKIGELKLEAEELRKTASDATRDKDVLESKLEFSERHLEDLKQREAVATEKAAQTQAALDQAIARSREELRAEADKWAMKVSAMEERCSEAENCRRDAERELSNLQSTVSKEAALAQQKAAFQEEQVEQAQKRESELRDSISELKAKLEVSQQNSQQRLEQQQKELEARLVKAQNALDGANEQASLLGAEKSRLESKLEDLQSSSEKQHKDLAEQVTAAQSHLAQTTETMEKSISELRSKESTLHSKVHELEEQLRAKEASILGLEQQISSAEAVAQKERELLEQKVEQERQGSEHWKQAATRRDEDDATSRAAVIALQEQLSTSNMQAKQDREDFADTKAKLEERIDSLKQQVTSAKQKLAEGSQSISELKQDLENAVAEAKASSQQISALQQELKDKDNALQAIDTEAAEVQEQAIVRLQSEKQTLEAELKRVEELHSEEMARIKEAGTLALEQKELEFHQTEAEYDEEIGRLEGELGSAQSTIKELQGQSVEDKTIFEREMQALRSKIDEVVNIEVQQRNRAEKAEAAAVASEEMSGKIQRELQVKSERCQWLEDNMKSQQQNYEGRLREADNRSREREEQIQSLYGDIRDTEQRKNEELEKLRQSCRQQLDECESKLSKSEATSLRDAAMLQGKVEHLQNQLESLHAELASVKQEHRQSASFVQQSCDQQVAEINQQAAAERRELQSIIDSLRTDKSELQGKLKPMESSIEEAKVRHQNEVSKLEAVKQKLEEQLDSQTKALQQLKNTSEEKEHELELKLTNLQTSIENREATAKQERSRLVEEAEGLRSRIEALELERKSLESERVGLQVKVLNARQEGEEHGREEIKSLMADNRKVDEERIAALRADLKAANAELSACQNEVSQLRSSEGDGAFNEERARLTTMVESLQTQLDRERERSQSLQDSYSSVRADFKQDVDELKQKHKAKKEKLESELREEKSTQAALRRELDSLRGAYDFLKSSSTAGSVSKIRNSNAASNSPSESTGSSAAAQSHWGTARSSFMAKRKSLIPAKSSVEASASPAAANVSSEEQSPPLKFSAQE